MGVAGLQGDGQTENLADAGQFLQALVTVPFSDHAQHMLFNLGDGLLELSHQFDLLAAQELVGWFGETGAGVLGAHGLDAGQWHALAQGAFVEALETQNQAGALAHQQQPAA